MDVILRNYSDERVIVVTPFMIRTSDETFRYELDRHTLAGGDIIARFYQSLEKRIKQHYQQWYFIHEVHESFATEEA
jgi:lauroyl/myristoyl acyltransferase